MQTDAAAAIKSTTQRIAQHENQNRCHPIEQQHENGQDYVIGITLGMRVRKKEGLDGRNLTQ